MIWSLLFGIMWTGMGCLTWGVLYRELEQRWADNGVMIGWVVCMIAWPLISALLIIPYWAGAATAMSVRLFRKGYDDYTD
jgi:hypothetical protein